VKFHHKIVHTCEENSQMVGGCHTGFGSVRRGLGNSAKIRYLQQYISVCSIADMTESVRMPVSIASRKGVSALTHEVAGYRVVLTSLGRAVAVVDTAERIDEDLRKIREAARLVVESMAENAKGRSTTLDLEEVCNRLGISVADVHARAQQLQDA
jgi:hypothetical protein